MSTVPIDPELIRQLALLTDSASIGNSFWNPQDAVALRAVQNKATRDRARMVGFHPPGDPVNALVAALNPQGYIESTQQLEGSNPEAGSPADAIGGLFMSQGGMPSAISRAGSLPGGTDWMPKGSRPRLRPGQTIEQNMPAVPPVEPKGEELLLTALMKAGKRMTAPARKDALATVGGFSRTSKMPGKSWSCPAGDCESGQQNYEAGMKMVSNGTFDLAQNFPKCTTCFGRGGRYVFDNVKIALDRRLKAWQDSPVDLKTGRRPGFINGMATALIGEDGPNRSYFRWFDVGDLQRDKTHPIDNFQGRTAMIGDIVEIAKRTPWIKHWLPTTNRSFVDAWMKANPGQGFPENLAVRPSLPTANVPAEDYVAKAKPNPSIPSATLPVSGVLTKESRLQDRAKNLCAAYTQDKTCASAECRDCWDKTKSVNYPHHLTQDQKRWVPRRKP